MRNIEIKTTLKESESEELKHLRGENKILKQEREILEKNGILRKGNSLKYAWIQKQSKSFNINIMCKILKINRASYYHWIEAGCVIQKVDTQLNELIKSIFVFLEK